MRLLCLCKCSVELPVTGLTQGAFGVYSRRNGTLIATWLVGNAVKIDNMSVRTAKQRKPFKDKYNRIKTCPFLRTPRVIHGPQRRTPSLP